MDIEEHANMHDNERETTAKKIELTAESVLVDLYKMSANESMEKVASTSKSPKVDVKTWKEEDICMAPYSDGRWYHAKILKMRDEAKCRVIYTEYGEEGDVEVAQLLSESDVEHPEEQEKMDTVVYEKPPNPITKTLKSNRNDRFPVPSICPPPPELFAKLSKVSSEKDSLTNMLMSWYMSGYHTGYHEGLKEGRKTQNGVENYKRGGR